jgi:hypothetical protein
MVMVIIPTRVIHTPTDIHIAAIIHMLTAGIPMQDGMAGGDGATRIGIGVILTAMDIVAGATAIAVDMATATAADMDTVVDTLADFRRARAARAVSAVAGVDFMGEAAGIAKRPS